MRTAAVVGGGLGGLATALGLIRHGWDVTVYEQAPGFGEVGAGITLWGNAFLALDALGVGDQVRAIAGSPGRAGFRDRKGRWLMRGSGDPEELGLVHRADLHAVLRDALPAESLLAGRRIEDVRIEGGRAVVGSSAGDTSFDLLVGADGLRSRVRDVLWPEAAAPKYTGYTAWRMVLPAEGIPSFDGCETWGDGLTFGSFGMGGGRIYCFAGALVPPGGSSPDGELAELRRLFAGWPDPIPTLLERVHADAVLRHDLYYLPPLRSFVRGPVALTGDAAHAMPPNLGQGACQSFEDAATLGPLVSGPDLAAGLREYDALRRPRTQLVVRRSIATGRMVHTRSNLVAAVRDETFRLLPSALFQRSLAAMLAWRPPVAHDVRQATP